MSRLRFLLLCLMLGFVLAAGAHAYRTVIILNDLFIDFSVTSDNPYWINDSQIVHNRGRVNYETDGKYILTNARSYYDILNRAYRDSLIRIWGKYVGGDFDEDVLEYYNARPQVNLSEDLDLRSYWYERKKEAFWDKE